MKNNLNIMKKVRFLDEPKESKEPKPIEFTHILDGGSGWEETSVNPNDYIEVIYLGKCKFDGHMFCCKGENATIDIYKGHLNDGMY